MRTGSIATIGVAVFALGCASAGPATEKAAEQSPQGTPLASMAGRPVLVLPVQRNVIVVDQTLDQAGAIEGWNFIVALDDSLASALSARGLGATWTFAPAITAAARRQGGLVADPHVLATGSLRKLVKAGDDALNEPLPTQLRSLVALREGRYAILPRCVAHSPAHGRSVLCCGMFASSIGKRPCRAGKWSLAHHRRTC